VISPEPSVKNMPLDLKPLTALRFAAALWVVSYHYWPHLAGAATPGLVANGYLGVELFFVLSGFILSHVYLEGFGQGRFRYGSFLWARIARVYPLHIAVLAGLGLLAIAATVAGMTLGTGLVNWAALPAHLLMLHAWGLAPAAAWNHPSWSISAEWFAYLTFPAFAWAAWRLKDRPNLAVVGVLILLFGLYTVFEALAGFQLTEATYKWGALRIVPCFAYGTAIYLVWRSGAMKTRTQAKFWSLAFLVLAMALAQVDAPDAAIVTTFGGLILALAGLTSTGSKVLSGRVGVYLGEISYSVYMVCFPWLLVFGKAMEKLGYGTSLPLGLWVVLLVGVVPLAAAAHHLVERPARTFLRAWADRGFPLGMRSIRPA
jgi:peptidoglycan/LPS O-acetylase OafA/YrhL